MLDGSLLEKIKNNAKYVSLERKEQAKKQVKNDTNQQLDINSNEEKLAK